MQLFVSIHLYKIWQLDLKLLKLETLELCQFHHRWIWEIGTDLQGWVFNTFE